MVSTQYACAYKEVIELLKYMPLEDVKKIPAKKILYFLHNMDKNYNYIIDKTKTFEEQEKSEITKAIFAILFRDYWATPTQKEKIIQKENYDLSKLEAEKREIYNPDTIFKTKKIQDKSEKETSIISGAKPIQYQPESFWHKILNLIRHFFKKF